MKPLIPFSMESGLEGNSKTVDNGPKQSNDYHSNTNIKKKNMKTIDHVSDE